MGERCLTARTPEQKLLSSMQGYADEDHGVKTGERTKRAHVAKARLGYAVGGRVTVYRNDDVWCGEDAHGRRLKSHVKRDIEPKEAAVVRRIFQMYASGLGGKAIAKRLNAEGALAPTPFVRKQPRPEDE